MRRILAHLNIVGFRRYAVELIIFLKKEIYKTEIFKNHIEAMKVWWLHGQITDNNYLALMTECYVTDKQELL